MPAQCVNHTSFTVLVWLHEPLSAPNLPRERIVADAYAALNPRDALWQAYNKEIDRLREAEALDDDDVRVLRFADESRRALMDLTLGDDEAFTEGTVAQVLERSRETARAALRSELADERAEGRRVAGEIRRSRDRVANMSEVWARRVANGVFAFLVIALILGTLCWARLGRSRSMSCRHRFRSSALYSRWPARSGRSSTVDRSPAFGAT